LESLIDLIYNPGVINIDFADLRTILKGRGNSAFLNTIEESGKDRVEKTCENIFKNPLLQTTAFKAEKILFDVAGSDGLSMFEVEKISSHIANLNPNAKIIFGISKDSKLKNRIKTTILMTSGQVEEEELKEEVEKPQPEVITEKKEVAKENIKKEAPVKLKKSKIKPKKQKSAKKPVVEEGSKGHPEEKPESILPVFNVPSLSTVSALDQKRIEIMQADEEYSETGKKAIRRSGLEIRKAEELQEKKRIAQEKEWEIPAFLRKVKFKS